MIRNVDVLESIPATADESDSSLPFFEAYFSNFIEGTEFTIDEAERIVTRERSPRPGLKMPTTSSAHIALSRTPLTADMWRLLPTSS